MRGPLASVLVGAVALGVAGPEARGGVERVHLRYDAPPVCAPRTALEQAVAARTQAAELTADAATSARTFAVVITETDAGYEGSLAVDGDGGVSSRALSAPRCDDLVEALALVIALAIDPSAPLGPVVAAEPRVAAAPRPPSPSPWWGALFVAGGTGAGIAPGPMIAGGAEARIGRGRAHGAIALTLGRDGVDAAGGDARFLWLAGRAALCWRVVGSSSTASIAVDACAHAEIGGVMAAGRDVPRAQETARLWVAPGPHARVGWASGRLFTEVQGGASIPLLRDRFYFQAGDTIHRTWPIAPWVLAGAGIRFR